MKKLSQLNETTWGGMVRRSNSQIEVRKENRVEILYIPKTIDELREIINIEIKNQGGKDIDLRMIDVSKIENMKYTFHNYSSIQFLNLSNWDVSNITDMKCMFSGCTSLQSLDVSNWDVSKVEKTRGMFYECSSLQFLDLSDWDVSNLVDMKYMFEDCSIQYKKEGNKLIRI